MVWGGNRYVEVFDQTQKSSPKWKKTADRPPPPPHCKKCSEYREKCSHGVGT